MSQATCRCGIKHEIAPNTKVLCQGCGMAFSTVERATGRFVVKAEDLRAAAIGRTPKAVRDAMAAEAEA
jgi:hypothetical protein